MSSIARSIRWMKELEPCSLLDADQIGRLKGTEIDAEIYAPHVTIG
jgi:hypothetical protein